MENHIYPLNIEEPTPLGQRSKKKKPTFKEWIKGRKKMVIFVCTVAVLALATVTIYATGLSDKLLGLIDIDMTMPIDQAGVKPMIDQGITFNISGTISPSKPQYKQGITLKFSANNDATLKSIKILKNDEAETLVKDISVSGNSTLTKSVEKTITWDGKDKNGAFTAPGSYKFKVTADYFVPSPTIPDFFDKKTFIKEFPFTITALETPKLEEFELSGATVKTEYAAGEEVTLKFTANIWAVVNKIEILKGSTIIKELPVKDLGIKADEEQIFKWDGKNSSGEVMGSGDYKFKTTVTYITINSTPMGDVPATKTLEKEFLFKIVSSQATLTFADVNPKTQQVVGKEVTFRLEANANAAPYVFKIDYGDGKNETKDLTSNIAIFKHTYTKVGTYTVRGEVTSKLNPNDPVLRTTTYKVLETYQCSNGTDDDGDGKVDLNDPDCTAASDNDEADVPTPPVVTQCNDKIDNDTDGKVDFLGIIGKEKDPDCTSADDISEAPDTVVPPPPNDTPEPPLAAKETKCDDGKDNDNDGKKDYEDSDCKAPKDASIKITDVGVTSQKLNPALNAVKIYYKLSDSANVKVEIKSTKGDITVLLFEGKQEKQVGNFSVWWEGTIDNKPTGQKAPDGTYTYKISAEHLKYPSVKDSKEGTITVDSTYNPGGLDFEDINNANLLGNTGEGSGTGTNQGTPSTPSQNNATVTLQNSATGSTAGTGPGVVIYFLFPLFAYAYRKIKY